MKALGKISIATIGTKPKRAHKDVDNIKTPLMRVMGVATGLKQAVDMNGEPTFGLVGQFLAINIAEEIEKPGSGEYTSGVLYLPGGLQELVQAPLEVQMNDPDKAIANSASVQFSMDVFSVPATNKSGYSFEADLLGDAVRADPFAAIKATIGETKLPALPSPDAIKKAQAKATPDA